MRHQHHHQRLLSIAFVHTTITSQRIRLEPFENTELTMSPLSAALMKSLPSQCPLDCVFHFYVRRCCTLAEIANSTGVAQSLNEQ